jgi:hypothetical protein
MDTRKPTRRTANLAFLHLTRHTLRRTKLLFKVALGTLPRSILVKEPLCQYTSTLLLEPRMKRESQLRVLIPMRPHIIRPQQAHLMLHLTQGECFLGNSFVMLVLFTNETPARKACTPIHITVRGMASKQVLTCRHQNLATHLVHMHNLGPIRFHP